MGWTKKRIKEEKEMSAEARLIMAQMEKQKKQTKILLVGVVIVGIVISSVVASNLFTGSQRKEFKPVVIEEGKIKIHVSEVDDGQIHYYTATNPNKTKFYIHKNPYSNIHARLSICDPCAGNTFTLINDGYITDCDVCHTRWDSDSYNGIYPQPDENRVGGCEDYPPGYLPYTMEGEYIVIQESDLTK